MHYTLSPSTHIHVEAPSIQADGFFFTSPALLYPLPSDCLDPKPRKALRPRFCIVQAGNDEEALPSAATCLNLLRLPEYTSKETLRSKLAYALEHGGGYWTA